MPRQLSLVRGLSTTTAINNVFSQKYPLITNNKQKCINHFYHTSPVRFAGEAQEKDAQEDKPKDKKEDLKVHYSNIIIMIEIMIIIYTCILK